MTRLLPVVLGLFLGGFADDGAGDFTLANHIRGGAGQGGSRVSGVSRDNGGLSGDLAHRRLGIVDGRLEQRIQRYGRLDRQLIGRAKKGQGLRGLVRGFARWRLIFDRVHWHPLLSAVRAQRRRRR